MKKNKVIIGSFLLFIFSLGIFLFSQGLGKVTKNELITFTVFKMLVQLHVAVKELDAKFVESIFPEFIKNTDSLKQFFLQKDVDFLKQLYQKRNGPEYYKNVYQVLDNRIKRVESIVKKYFKRKISFKRKEFLETEEKNIVRCKTEREFKQRWEKLIKYRILSKYLELMKEKIKKREKEEKEKIRKKEHKGKKDEIKLDEKVKEEIKNEVYKKYADKLDTKLLEQAKKKAKKSILLFLKRIKELKDDEKFSFYLNSILSICDPHSNYFLPEAKEDFDIEMSGRLEGIGASLREEDGVVKVVEIIPGSASWRQGELESGDLILKVGQGEKGEMIDIEGMPLRDVVKMIRGPKGTKVRLLVKKQSGTLEEITITRDVVVIEESYAKAAVLTSEAGKTGYIYLPKFYHDFTGKTNKNCADDVKKLLLELKDEGIDSLIFDLRGNTGGSLADAVRIAGFFIDKGPIVQVKDKMRMGGIHYDKEAGKVYGGPLVVLTNRNSASASEIVSAALQDYGRAVIVGGEHTFGKGTVQTIIDLDRYLAKTYPQFAPFGTVKLTIQKFYRINGGTTQYKGVESDIILPDVLSAYKIGEKYLDHALKWDTIAPLEYQKDNYITTDIIEKLRKKSEERVNNDKHFKKLKEAISKLKKLQKDTIVPLNFQSFMKRNKFYEDYSKKLDKLKLEKPIFGVKLLTSAKQEKLAQEDKKEKEKLDKFVKNLKKDLILSEAYYIVRDLEDLKGKEK